MSWGGARAGAGRPANGPVPSEPHKTRPRLSPRHPVHVSARVVRFASARATAYKALRRALTLSLARADFRIIHVAFHRRRVELVVEADDKTALARGMQGFQVSAAKWLNRSVGRRGTVFPDRYRMRVLTTRVDVRDVVGRLPLARTDAWPQTWLLRVEAPPHASGARRERPRRWLRSRADEDS